MFSYKTEYSCHRLGMSINHLETGLNKITLHEIFQPHQLGVPFPEFLIILMFAKREHLVAVTLS